MRTTPTTGPTSSPTTGVIDQRTSTGLDDPPVPVRLRLALLWVAMLLVVAYVDVFMFFRADVLEAALDGEVSGTAFAVGQGFLVGALGYVLPAILMVVASLYLRARALRTTTLVLAPLYAASIVWFCVGETWVYYLTGSAVEVVLLVAITATAWRWRR